ncbi:MAG: CehA/McbA family metallohydrolase [Planctomycetota bacterium]|nr:CehA/McbA family metallohydrolase [Planctomycetota bacterium]
MRRFADMAKEGWWSGDMYVNRDLRNIQLLMRAEDLYVAQLVTWPTRKHRQTQRPADTSPLVNFDKRRYYHQLAGRDARAGGGLCFYQLDGVPELYARREKLDAEYPAAVEIARELKQRGAVWVEADTAGCWDLPVWVAHDLIDSVRLADQRFGRDRFFAETRGQRPRDAAVYGGAHGAGRWSEHVYYQLLNCGLRIPPTAGSGSGDVPNPLGHNRVYAYCGEYFSYTKWWEALSSGRVVVTNGPLLRPFVEGHPPGHVFQGDAGTNLQLNVDLQLATKEKVEYLELIKNGELAMTVRLDDYVDRQGRLPPLEFKASGWFLVRAVTEAAKTYRFATSGPFYVQIGSQPRCSRRAAEFFRDWVQQRARQIKKIPDEEQQQQIMNYHRQAHEYWNKLVETANAD